jgi:hypothetical protein
VLLSVEDTVSEEDVGQGEREGMVAAAVDQGKALGLRFRRALVAELGVCRPGEPAGLPACT